MLLNQVDVSFENVRELLDLSQHKLVVFAFWSDRSEPSKQLLQTLASICSEHPAHLALAKVNCDLDQELAAQFGVRSLPTAMFIQNGQPVDGFAGAESDAQIRLRLQPYLPAPEELLMQQIQPLLEGQQWAEAYPLLKQAQQLAPARVDICKFMALCAASLGQIEQAKTLLSNVLLADQDSLYHQVQAVIELAEQAADSPEIRALEAKLAAAPDDSLLKQQLAVQYQQVQRSEDALVLLFSILQQDLNFGDSKKLFLDILAVLPKGDALAGTYRRKLYSLLY
ncbi:MAG: tetratricopeptide repeat protein [Gammaproteobacteria bacterium]|nr:tetratricopeptide repeat protein [Gammaproteobacteria bacterium]MBU2223491.1 tetratricopeptide repeat protein [Gammaproteobacteria bacterium]MBU2279213.1 tetratricopeptide repeat protein [Gammaproteobacteria bacterium]MBU2427057.1 tetratricopeptide repeat protein [Gammaproteobacteria bacterium]